MVKEIIRRLRRSRLNGRMSLLSSSERKRFHKYVPAALGLIILAVGISFVVHARFVGSTSGSGSQWQADGLAGVTVHYLAVGHTRAPIAFAATESGVYRRGADGTWTRVLAQSGIWSIDLLPDDRTVIAGDQQGNLDLSADAGAHWRAAKVASDAVYAVTFVGRSRSVILAGAGGGLFRSVDGGAHWIRRLPLHDSAIAALTWLPGSNQVVFAGAVASAPAGATGVYVSRDAGLTWSQYGRRLNSGGGIMSLAVSRGSRLLAGTMGQAVWVVAGVTDTWGRTAAGMPARNDHIAGIAVAPDRPGTVYAGTLGFGVFETRDGGKRWTNVSDGLRGSTDAMIVLSLAYAPAQHILYAGTSTGVYRLTQPVASTVSPPY
jgi:photosystem II stability/assembly factor-like uncharacterized protein